MVRVVSVADVACANTQTAASQHWLWRLVMNSLLTLKERGGMWLRKQTYQWQCSNHLQGSLEKVAGKLCAKFSKSKGGAERKIMGSKTRIVLQSDDVVDVGAVQDELQQTEVLRCTKNQWNDYVHVLLGGPGSVNCLGKGGNAIFPGERGETKQASRVQGKLF